MYSLQQIATLCNGKLYSADNKQTIHNFATDSRKTIASQTLFIALKGERFDAHRFIPELIQREVTAFLISDKQAINTNHSFILVEDTLTAFQKIAKHHREQFDLPIIGITGSFAKTIIKEWLFQLLSPNFYIVKSPKSYNSQIGVPISVLELNSKHELGIFEAGISKPNEMQKLAEIIQPNIGIITTIGSAHAKGFINQTEKLEEKIRLFADCNTIICEQKEPILSAIEKKYPTKKIITWQIENNQCLCLNKRVSLPDNQNNPFFKHNISHCIAIMLHLGIAEEEIEQRIKNVETLPMRLEIVNGKQGNIILNDSYSNDLSGLEISLEHAKKIAPNKPITLVLSSFQESGLSDELLREKIAEILAQQQINNACLIGEFYQQHADYFTRVGNSIDFFKTTAQAISTFNWASLHNQMIVVKGARADKLETLVAQLREKTHHTVWEINLSHLIENLNFYKSRLQNKVKLLVMVKATAYGTEANKIAQTLQNQRVDYLGVAYADEGANLRQDGITLPILVMNCAPSQFQFAYNHQLEILVHSAEQLRALIRFCEANAVQKFPIHIKLETGMNRLGFQKIDINELIETLSRHEAQIEVKGILSHLAVADMPKEKVFTDQQITLFDELSTQLIAHLPNSPIRHLLNSAGIGSNNPQFDMVRLGIGMHGISSNPIIKQEIKQVGKLIATISQIKTINKGDTVSYGRKFTATKPTKIAIISVGYADGYDRRFSNGVGEVIIHGKRAQTIGAICMDMTIVDVTNITEAKVGDEVILTSEELPITELAERINTIPYELLTSISTRVQRRFIYE